jgi:hypothetical protein
MALADGRSLGGEDAYEQPPISYSATSPKDAIHELERRIAAGEFRFEGSDREVARALLKALHIPESSQVLVFSKTSFQLNLIHPATPRAIYFSTDCYVGWCPGGLMEVASVDPELGPIFYTFDPHLSDGSKPVFRRDPDCLRCHGGTFVREIPAVFVRSVATERNGQPIFSQGSTVVDDTTPFSDRWAGWYVTGSGGSVRHRGNLLSRERNGGLVVEVDHGANRTALPEGVDSSRFLAAGSDVVALMVMEHQCGTQNILTRAGHQCRRILQYQQNLQRDLKETVQEEPAYDSAKRVYDSCAQEVLDRMLFRDAAALPEGAIAGRLAFATDYAGAGVRTKAGHSLSDLDLKQRLYTTRCSPMIHSDCFRKLPQHLRERILERLHRVVEQPESEPRYAYLETAERQRLGEILTETVPGFARR